MKDKEGTSNRPYTYDDLALATRDYAYAKAIYDTADLNVKQKQAVVAGFEKEREEAAYQVNRHKVHINKILANLEK